MSKPKFIRTKNGWYSTEENCTYVPGAQIVAEWQQSELDKARERAARIFPDAERKRISEAFADYDGQETLGKYPE